MDIHSNAVPNPLPADEFFPSDNNMDGGGGVSLEWLSLFVEECLNGGGFASQQPPMSVNSTNDFLATKPPPTTSNCPKPTSKSRSKRKRLDSSPSPDSPLLPKAYWLAESELIVLPPPAAAAEKEDEEDKEEKETVTKRRCAHCMSEKTPQWRAGPQGPKTLCNACGVRFKSGRLLPEYRPDKSPTFQSFKHSNSHKKMRMYATTNYSSKTILLSQTPSPSSLEPNPTPVRSRIPS